MSFPINLCALVVRCSGPKNLFVDREQFAFSRLDPFCFLRRVIFQASMIPERRIAGNPASDRLICCSRIPRDAKFGDAREAGRTAAFGWDGA